MSIRLQAPTKERVLGGSLHEHWTSSYKLVVEVRIDLHELVVSNLTYFTKLTHTE